MAARQPITSAHPDPFRALELQSCDARRSALDEDLRRLHRSDDGATTGGAVVGAGAAYTLGAGIRGGSTLVAAAEPPPPRPPSAYTVSAATTGGSFGGAPSWAPAAARRAEDAAAVRARKHAWATGSMGHGGGLERAGDGVGARDGAVPSGAARDDASQARDDASNVRASHGASVRRPTQLGVGARDGAPTQLGVGGVTTSEALSQAQRVPKPGLARPARREQLDGHVLAEHAARQQAAWQARQQELMVIGTNGLPAEVRARHGARGQVQARSTHPSTRAEPYDSRRVEPYDSRRVEPYDSRPDSSACNGSYCASVSDAAITAAEDIRRRGVDNKGSTKTYQREPPLVDRRQTGEGARQYASTHEAAGGMLWHGRLEGPPEKRSSAAIKQMVERDSPAPQPARVKDTSGVPRAVCYPTRGAPASIFR